MKRFQQYYKFKLWEKLKEAGISFTHELLNYKKMTKEQFDDFIAENDLYSFDGLISITLENEEKNEAVWLTTLPQLEKSVDGKFAGMAEKEVFYLFAKGEYLVCSPEEIRSIECVQNEYLR